MNTKKRVTCPSCGNTFEAVGQYADKVPEHGEGWKSCPGSYQKGENA